MKTCQNCSKEIDKTAKFCNYCGFSQTTTCNTSNSSSEINGMLIICFAVIGCLLFMFLTHMHTKKEEPTAEMFTFALGLTPEQAQSIVKSVIAKGVTSQEDLDRKLMFYEGGERLVRQLNYHDSNNITINIDGENKDATKLTDLYNKPIKRTGVDLVNLRYK